MFSYIMKQPQVMLHELSLRDGLNSIPNPLNTPKHGNFITSTNRSRGLDTFRLRPTLTDLQCRARPLALPAAVGDSPLR